MNKTSKVQAYQIVAIILGSYQGRFEIHDDSEIDSLSIPGTVSVYHMAIRDIEVDFCKAAVMDLCYSDNPYPPTPGQIRRRAIEISMGTLAPVGPFEAWERTCAYSQGKIKNLSDIEKKALNMIGGVWEIKNNSNTGLLRRDFVKYYEQLYTKKMKEYAAMPAVRRVAENSLPKLPCSKTVVDTVDEPKVNSEEVKKMVRDYLNSRKV